MYSEIDDDSDTEQEFLRALALLRSNDEGSAEELHKMLNASIERMLDPAVASKEETSLIGATKNSEGGTDPRQRQLSRSVDVNAWERNESYLMEGSKRIPPEDDRNRRTTTRDEFVESFGVFVDATEKGDIPRISIPDEGSGDGILCKVCNGAKLGPLILLECQDCQDVYHPLCHQPPVVDIDVYDPRLVWQCGSCSEASHATATAMSTAAAAETLRDARRTEGRPDSAIVDEGGIEEKELSYFRRNKSKFSDTGNIGREVNSSANEYLAMRARRTYSNGAWSKKAAVSSSAGVQLRRRIGSKLTVARASIK